MYIYTTFKYLSVECLDHIFYCPHSIKSQFLFPAEGSMESRMIVSGLFQSSPHIWFYWVMFFFFEQINKSNRVDRKIRADPIQPFATFYGPPSEANVRRIFFGRLIINYICICMYLNFGARTTRAQNGSH